MQMLVPSYLEFSIDKLTRDQQKFRDQFTSALGSAPFGEPTRSRFRRDGGAGAQEYGGVPSGADHVQSLRHGRRRRRGTTAPSEEGEGASAKQQSDVDDLKRQLDALNKRIDKLSGES